MAVLTVQQVNLDGISPTFVAADAGGDEFVNSGKAVLHVKNDGTNSITVTVNS